MFPSPKKFMPKENSAVAIDRLPIENQNKWSCILIHMDFFAW